jgi:hypothetical protein
VDNLKKKVVVQKLTFFFSKAFKTTPKFPCDENSGGRRRPSYGFNYLRNFNGKYLRKLSVQNSPNIRLKGMRENCPTKFFLLWFSPKFF